VATLGASGRSDVRESHQSGGGKGMSALAREPEPIRVLLEMPAPAVRALRIRLRPHRHRVELLVGDPTEARADLVLVDPYDENRGLRTDLLTRDRGALRYAVLTGGPLVETLMWLLLESALEGRLVGWIGPDLSPDSIVEALERMARNEVVIATRAGSRQPRTDPDELTQRELDVLRLVARGHSNREISAVLSLSPNTVKTYIRLAYRRIGVSSRSQAVLWAVGHGLHGETVKP
jgi:NarL family two-component system response regulator LiaR